jgi:hypothetical protein
MNSTEQLTACRSECCKSSLPAKRAVNPRNVASFGDPERADRAQSERAWLVGQLSAAYGLGGRPRAAGDPVERARQAVKWRVRHAIDRIARVHPPLGRHLRNSIKTGAYCAYLPENPVAWLLWDKLPTWRLPMGGASSLLTGETAPRGGI